MKLCLLLLIALPSFALASGQECISMPNDLDRLACYDREFGRSPAVTNIETVTEWNVRIETSKMTDETSVFMSLESKEEVSCGYSRGGAVTLVVRCLENTTSMIFSTDCHMTSSKYNDYGDVTYRLDDDPAKVKGFIESTNNRSLGLWSGGSSIPVIKSMFGKNSLLARMTPYSENPFTATFNISGIEAEIEPLRKACGW